MTNASSLLNVNNDHSYLQVNISKGSGYVEFKNRTDAEKAQLYMDGVWISDESFAKICS